MEDKMYVVYNPKYPTVVEAVCSSSYAVENAVRADAELEWLPAAHFVTKVDGKFSTDGLKFVVFYAKNPLRVEALVATPEMALDIILGDEYHWRVVPHEMGALLYIRPKSSSYTSWKCMQFIENQENFQKTFEELVLNFMRDLDPALKLWLKGDTISNYRIIVDEFLAFPLAVFLDEAHEASETSEASESVS
jgi:hypothetical protein